MDQNPISTINVSSTVLVEAVLTDFRALQQWFTHPRDVLLWAGPSFVFPCSEANFTSQLSEQGFKSFALKQTNTLVAFGQFQLHGSNAHFGRLAVNPQYRKQALSYALINALIERASNANPEALKTISLFVFTANKAAVTSYTNMGFVKAEAPASYKRIKQCDYMLLHL